jgi:hypothetical protein
VVEGFCNNEVTPFPNSHRHCVGVPVEESLKLTTSGEQPERGEPEKLADSWPKATAWQHIKKTIARNRQWFLTITVIGLDVSVNVGYLIAKIVAAKCS